VSDPLKETVPQSDTPRERLGWRLVVIDAQGARTVPLPPEGEVTVGRSSEATVTVDDPVVSRVHLTLLLGESVAARDLGSSNGTRLRGAPLDADAPSPVSPGDLIELGATSLMVLPLHGVAATRAFVDSGPPSPAFEALRGRVVIEDDAMRQLYKLIERVAPGMISVILLGETGVGKEVVAEALHRLSPRAERPFVRLNCAALSESLLESELFGHEKGAFTGAVQARAGLLESADGGTVFLDEVGEMPVTTQVKLLRVIEERRVTRVGATRPRDLDVRFVSATHRDLEAEIARGRFRQDLYFRLNGISVVIPPLRERAREIDALARFFAAEGARRAGLSSPPALTPEALAALRAHAWPGNLREMRNVLERAVLLAGEGPVTPEHLPGVGARPRSVAPPAPEANDAAPAPDAARGGARQSELDAIERQRILDALERCAGNQTLAARILGMSRRTFVNRLTEYNIARPRKQPHAR
jgi:DNA-binding NtrC family response regulator